MLLVRAVSICHMPGARTRLRPALPQAPLAGMVNAAALIQWLGVWPPGGITDTPGTRFGRCGEVVLPSGREDALREIVTFTGTPVRAVPIPLSSHPPNTFPTKPFPLRYFLPGPQGN